MSIQSADLGHLPKAGVRMHPDRNFIKGILILFVIADHNDFIRALFPREFRPLTLHVLAFFFLAFPSYMERVPDRAFYADRVVRYGVPFLFFYSGYALLNLLLNARHGLPVFQEAGLNLIAGALIGSFDLVKKGTGAGFLWFLPSFLGFVVLVSATSRLSGIHRTLAIGFAFLAHFFTGALPSSIKTYVPLGLPVGLYILPLAYSCFWIEKSTTAKTLIASRPAGLLLGTISLSAYAFLVSTGENIEIGTLEVPILHANWTLTAAQDLSVLTGFFFLLYIARYAGKFMGPVKAAGRYSLLIYLIHPAVFFLVRQAISVIVPAFIHANEPSTITGAVALFSVGLTAYLSFLIARGVSTTPVLAKLITPKDRRDWQLGVSMLVGRTAA